MHFPLTGIGFHPASNRYSLVITLLFCRLDAPEDVPLSYHMAVSLDLVEQNRLQKRPMLETPNIIVDCTRKYGRFPKYSPASKGGRLRPGVVVLPGLMETMCKYGETIADLNNRRVQASFGESG